MLTNPRDGSLAGIESSRSPNFEAHGANAGTECLRSQILPTVPPEGRLSSGEGTHIRDEPCLLLLILCATVFFLFQGAITCFIVTAENSTNVECMHM